MDQKPISIRNFRYALFFCIVGFYLVHLYLIFPGQFGGDEIYLLKAFKDGQLISSWHCLVQSLLVRFSLLLTGGLFLGPTIQVVAFLGLVYWLLSLIQKDIRINDWLRISLLIFVSVLSLHPVFLNHFIGQNRDMIFSILTGYLILAVYRFKDPNHLKQGGWVILLTALCDGTRQDAFFYYVPVVWWGLLILKLKRQDLLKLCAALVLVATLIHLILPSLFGYRNLQPVYRATAYVQPIAAIIKSEEFGLLDADDLDRINRVFDLNTIRIYDDTYDIASFNSGRLFRPEQTEDDWKRFEERIPYLILDHIKPVFRQRIQFNLSLFNLRRKIHEPLFQYDGVRSTIEHQPEKFFSLTGLTPIIYPEYRSTVILDRLENVLRSSNEFLQVVLIGPVLRIGFLLIAAIAGFWIPVLMPLTMIALIRLPVVMALAPSTLYKYLLPFDVAFMVLFPIVVSEILLFIRKKKFVK